MKRMRKGSKSMALLLAALVTACSGGKRAPDFVLQDDGGNAWTLSQQRGKVVLLTFGFTHCADTCPATVAKLAQLGRLLPRKAGDFEVAFVTVDPARDSSSALHRFVERFAQEGNARVVGLTGSFEQISRVEREYNVWSAPTAHDIAHSAVIFLIDSHGRMRDIRDDSDSESSLAHAVRGILRAS
jgi:protein SCO1